MSSDTSHPLLQFANKYSDPMQDYLNAYMVVARLEVLGTDLAKLNALLEADVPETRRWAPWFGAEVVSYYAVGLVTCLEWHAKSRLVDLFTHDPSALRLDDVRGTIGDKLIVEMVGKQASVVQLVGAAVKVGNWQKYLSILGRVFTSLGLPFTVVEWLLGQAASSTVCWVAPQELALLERLYEFRHELVHELGMSVMGHPNVRDLWSPSEARRYCGIVTSVVHGVEAALTLFAPKLFPNKLTEDRYPVSEVENLTEEMRRLDAFATKEVEGFEWPSPETAERWQAARVAFAAYEAREEEFIEAAGMLHWRYFDARTPLRLRLVRYRLGFLRELLSHFSTNLEDNPNMADRSANAPPAGEV